MFTVDPVTFKLERTLCEKAYDELERFLELRGFWKKFDKNSGKSESGDTRDVIQKLKSLNDEIYSAILDGMWSNIPADTRFPGFFSSLADHTFATVTIAAPLALEAFRKRVDFGSEYCEGLKDVLRQRDGVIEVTRTIAYLHDLGKHPPRGHCERTEKFVGDILKKMGLPEEICSEIAESASRHHYGFKDSDDSRKPEKKLEWILAFADTISSVQDRVLSGTFLEIREPYTWLNKYSAVDLDRFFEVLDKLKSNELKAEEVEDVEKIWRLPLSFEQVKSQKVFEAEKYTGVSSLALFCFEVAGISEFVKSSDMKRYFTGASSLVDYVLLEAKESVSQKVCPESVIYAKGGSLLAVIPPSMFEELKQEVKRLFEEETKTLNLKFPEKYEFKLWEFMFGPKLYFSKNTPLLPLLKRRNFGSLVSLVISSLKTESAETKVEAVRVSEICSVCNAYKAESNDKEFACNRCRAVLNMNEKIRPMAIETTLFSIDLSTITVTSFEENRTGYKTGDVLQDISYFRILRKMKKPLENKLKRESTLSLLISKGFKKINFRPVVTWDELGKQHVFDRSFGGEEGVYDIAFIKGDGDNFGKIKSGACSITMHRQMSRILEDVIEDTIAEALAEVIVRQIRLLRIYDSQLKDIFKSKDRSKSDEIGLKLPFEIIFAGGDDFFIVLDAAFLFTFLIVFRSILQRKLGERVKKPESYLGKSETDNLSVIPLGVSMGVAIVKNRMPVSSTLQAVNDMLEKAKRKSKSEAGGFGGEIFVFIRKFNSIPSAEEIEKLRHVNGSEISLTAFPMSGKELKEFVDNLMHLFELGARPNYIKKAFGEFDSLARPEEAYINLLYKLARVKPRSEKEMCVEWEILNFIREIHGQTFGKNVVYKHLDLADAMEIVIGVEPLTGTERAKILLSSGDEI